MKKLLLFLVFTTFAAQAKINVSELDFSSNQKQGILKIKFSGNLNAYPEMKVVNGAIHVDIPHANITRVIERNVDFITKNKDAKFTATQHTNNMTRVAAILPYSLNEMKDKVSLVIRDQEIELTFPRGKIESAPKPTLVVATPNVEKVTTAEVAKDVVAKLDESYLEELLKKDEKTIPSPSLKQAEVTPVFTEKTNETKDIVKTALASNEKNTLNTSKSSFSVMEYAGKFVAFLGFVLLLFYGVITLFKKGVMRKGKLGFLNNTEQVVVLSTTYVAPKKSLMMIKAHNQIFLVSNTDTGIHLVSEITDVSGLMKDGEKKIAGTNFDDNLNTEETKTKAAKNEREVILKQDIYSSKDDKTKKSDNVEVKDQVRLSDQLKKKVKNLKQLQ